MTASLVDILREQYNDNSATLNTILAIQLLDSYTLEAAVSFLSQSERDHFLTLALPRCRSPDVFRQLLDIFGNDVFKMEVHNERLARTFPSMILALVDLPEAMKRVLYRESFETLSYHIPRASMTPELRREVLTKFDNISALHDFGPFSFDEWMFIFERHSHQMHVSILKLIKVEPTLTDADRKHLISSVESPDMMCQILKSAELVEMFTVAERLDLLVTAFRNPIDALFNRSYYALTQIVHDLIYSTTRATILFELRARKASPLLFVAGSMKITRAELFQGCFEYSTDFFFRLSEPDQLSHIAGVLVSDAMDVEETVRDLKAFVPKLTYRGYSKHDGRLYNAIQKQLELHARFALTSHTGLPDGTRTKAFALPALNNDIGQMILAYLRPAYETEPSHSRFIV